MFAAATVAPGICAASSPLYRWRLTLNPLEVISVVSRIKWELEPSLPKPVVSPQRSHNSASVWRIQPEDFCLVHGYYRRQLEKFQIHCKAPKFTKHLSDDMVLRLFSTRIIKVTILGCWRQAWLWMGNGRRCFRPFRPVGAQLEHMAWDSPLTIEKT